ncbi:MAG: hypothetical protein SWX82_22590 [Cyanobacteriota bacterium]|nr:hypothetical protein [Cyanobacteriota bacterium]
MYKRLKLFFISISILILIVSCNFYTNSNSTGEFDLGVDIPEENYTDLDYIADLGLMRGHLVAAKELLDTGSPGQAQYHLAHPLEELYAQIEPVLKKQGIDTGKFHNSLEQLYETAEFKPYNQATKDRFSEAVNNIQSAIDKFFEKNPQSGEFVEKVFLSILETSAEEYGAGIGVNCKIIAPIEYQDSYGFVKYVKEELSRASWVSDTTREKFKPIVKELLVAWSPGEPPKNTTNNNLDCSIALSSVGNQPSVYPPEYPVMTGEKVSSLVENISIQ